MTQKPGKATVVKHLVELRREAIASLRHFNHIADRLNFYEQYLLLSKTHDVRLAGRFLVVKGGKSAESTDNDAPTDVKACDASR